MHFRLFNSGPLAELYPQFSPTSEDERALRERMGAAAYEKRIALERRRIDEYFTLFTARAVPLKVAAFRYFGMLALRCLGLARAAEKNFRAITVENQKLPIRNLPQEFDGFRILHLTDLHLDIDTPIAADISRAIEPLEYDICVITGDFRNMQIAPWENSVEQMKRIIPALHAPIYATLGNHDFAAMVAPLENLGVKFLLNENVIIKRDGAELALVGVDDPNIFENDDLPRAQTSIPRGIPRLLLSHSPCIYAKAADSGIDAIFAGHTHGGQVCLPGGKMITNNDPAPKKFHKGAWEFRGVRGYTGRGTGSCSIPVRFNCPPEVTIHTLKKVGGKKEKRADE